MLGLIFLKFADNKYRQHEAAIVQEYEKLKGTRREKSLEEVAIEKCGFFLQDYARYDTLLQLPDGWRDELGADVSLGKRFFVHSR